MLQNYFYDRNGLEQPKEVKREIAVAAVMEILLAAAPQSGGANTLGHIQNKLSDTVDALQKALEQ